MSIYIFCPYGGEKASASFSEQKEAKNFGIWDWGGFNTTARPVRLSVLDMCSNFRSHYNFGPST
jgi:hypothetical protein